MEGGALGGLAGPAGRQRLSGSVAPPAGSSCVGVAAVLSLNLTCSEAKGRPQAPPFSWLTS